MHNSYSNERRRFLRTSLLLVGQAALGSAFVSRPKYSDVILTVTGAIPPKQMGLTLPHEHIIVDFAGAEKVSPHRYDRNQVFDKALPYLKKVRALGCRTFVDCTPAFLARDPILLFRLSKASGLHILTNTGYYGARNDACLPSHAFSEDADQLADRWEREYKYGIEASGIHPGFIKIGVDEGPLSDIDRKLITAAARTHLRTGLTIAAHTGKATGAFEQLGVLEQEGVSPSAWIWVHAQAEDDKRKHAAAARAGAWVEFDGLGWNATERHVEFVVSMKEKGLLHRVLVSHDAGWYHVGEPGGGNFQPFEALFTEFLPALRKHGFTDADMQQLLVKNPMEAFTIRKRPGKDMLSRTK